MREPGRDYLGDFVSLLEAAGPGGDGGVPGEPRTSHRRGHWFKSSIAHHAVQYVEPL
ncbi:hypothetical protein ACFLUO_08320 [Chloroflexota bacterium]